jgi:nucleotide-binding universal stress UspA family protein
MGDPGRILVGADGSEQSDEAIRQADAWAKTHHWQLLVCHVAPLSVAANTRFAELEPKLARMLRRHVGKLIQHQAPATLIETGRPDAELVRAAAERSVGMIAVGSHSHSGLQQIFLGDVAESVAHHARCSVLVARPHPATRRIVVATDLSPAGVYAIALAAQHATRTGARLTVACSVEREMSGFGAIYGFVEAQNGDARQAAAAGLVDQLRAVGARGEMRVLDGNPAAAIIKAAAEIDAELLVIGAAVHLTDKIVRSAPCSVLVARP